MIAAATAAGVHDVILRLPQGYKTEVGEGGTLLSGGQRQRIALARALFGDPFLVVLDEPNSNLDALGEQALTKAIRAVRARGGIAVVIAHRPSAVAAVDHILVLNEGRVQAFGARDQILQQVTQPAPARGGAEAKPRVAGDHGDEQRPSRSIRAHLVAIAAAALFLVLGIGVIGATTELAGAIIASGALVVETNVKKVQHPTGGIVGELRVHDGSHVKAGDLLVRLDETMAQANVAMVENSLAELFARRARLEAERDGNDAVEFPEQLLQAAHQAEIGRVIAGERRLFEFRRDAQRGQKAQLRERVAQLNDEVRGYTDQAAAKKKEIEFIGKELEGVRDLWQKNLIPITRLTALERDGARLEGERGQLIATIAQGKGKISETELQIIQLDQNLRSEVAKELADIRAKIAELVERKVTADRPAAAHRHPRAAIRRRAPARGPHQGRRGRGRRADHADRAGSR